VKFSLREKGILGEIITFNESIKIID